MYFFWEFVLLTSYNFILNYKSNKFGSYIRPCNKKQMCAIAGGAILNGAQKENAKKCSFQMFACVDTKW